MPAPNDRETNDQTIVAPPEADGNDNEGNEPPELAGASYAKSFTGELKADDDERFFQATITTETVDRDGDVVLAKGLDFQNFLQNPVVLLGHPFDISSSFDLPIGKTNWIKAKGRKVIAEVTPAPTDMGNEIFELIKGGFLNAVSIGFRAIDSGPPTEKDLRAHPEWAKASRIFRKSELVEFSIVNVPANPEALISAVRKGNLSLSEKTLKQFGVTIKPVIENKSTTAIKRIVTITHTPIIRPVATMRRPALDAEQVETIIRRTAQTLRGRMVPA